MHDEKVNRTTNEKDMIMANSNTLTEEIKRLPLHQQQQIYSCLEEVLVLDSQVSQITEEVEQFRFVKGKVCPHCGAETVSRNGKYNGKQRYICKSCKKTLERNIPYSTH